MNTTISAKASRFLLPLAVIAAIIGGALIDTLGTPDADAALKWSEKASVPKENNRDGTKHSEPATTP